jgi:hypothetical protein
MVGEAQRLPPRLQLGNTARDRDDCPLFMRSNHPARLIDTAVRGGWTVAQIRRRVGALLSAAPSPQPWLSGAVIR